MQGKRKEKNVPACKEILKNCGQRAIFHVFKHDFDEVGHFYTGNRSSLKCFIEGNEKVFKV